MIQQLDPRLVHASETVRSHRPVAERGIRVAQSFLIGRPARELYDFWRDFVNLPRFMGNLERVEVIDQRRSRWVAKAPRVAGGETAWESEITEDVPGELIAWRTLPGAHVASVGEVRFVPALGDRGTEVRVTLDYVPPAGRLGHALATMLGAGPRRQVREDLRAFKRLMEIGELPTIEGQPRGVCVGRRRHLGRREGE